MSERTREDRALEYAPTPEKRPLQWKRKAAYLLIALLAITVFLGRNEIIDKLEQWRFERERFAQYRMLSTFNLPPEQVVFDSDTSPTNPLRANRDYTQLSFNGVPVGLGYMHPVRNAAPGALLFAHERRGVDGFKVVVEVVLTEADVVDPVFWGRSLRVTGRFSNGKNASAATIFSTVGSSLTLPLATSSPTTTSTPKRFRYFAGQPDPNDPCRFILDYDIDGKRGQLEGIVVQANAVSGHLQVVISPYRVPSVPQ